ncbi:hypothetical protein GCM10010103_32790 [Streptomyces paradoxus]|uniref:Uncharacterized protein n=1 Tax=Streptomyces paradoxus TaxID=66375 RepID=A0A7W9TAU4_9ACTN|nr:hypothetical protein [Streptomyces paradoxus]
MTRLLAAVWRDEACTPEHGAAIRRIRVVEYPDGGRYAVAVFTRTARTCALLPAADAVIGTAARLAVDALRAP